MAGIIPAIFWVVIARGVSDEEKHLPDSHHRRPDEAQ
jgi:hypothetical protein